MHITIEFEGGRYFVTRHDDRRGARRVRCHHLDQARRVAERMAAALGNCDIRDLASEKLKLWIDDLAPAARRELVLGEVLTRGARRS